MIQRPETNQTDGLSHLTTAIENTVLQSRKEGRKCLFNDAFNTFYLRLYGVRHMVNDHSDSKRENPLLPHGLQQGFFYMHHPTDRIAHTTAFVTPVMEHWLERVLQSSAILQFHFHHDIVVFVFGITLTLLAP